MDDFEKVQEDVGNKITEFEEYLINTAEDIRSKYLNNTLWSDGQARELYHQLINIFEAI